MVDKAKFLKDTERDEEGYKQDCSQIIDILQEIGGNQKYIESFGDIKYHYGVKCGDIISNLDLSKSHVVFTPSSRRGAMDVDSASGHFHFVNKYIGKCQDSYSLKWQKDGSNGFCQTFALMGALGMAEVFKGKTKEECSVVACNFLLQNSDKWFKKYWKTLCKNKGYMNIKDLSVQEIKDDLLTSMFWTSKKGGSTMFWNLVLDEVVYT